MINEYTRYRIPKEKHVAFLSDYKKNFDGPGIVFAIPGAIVISLQAARKPNSVLDDHSSTRRITAAL